MAAYEFRLADFAYIATGAAVLGSGGGGSYADALNLLKELEGWSGYVVVADYDGITPACVLAMMGSPDAGDTLKLADVQAAITNTLGTIEQASGTAFGCVIPVEIGALNSLVPLIAAAMSNNNLWVVNGDGAGRAVPQLVETTYSDAANLAVSPCVLGNEANGTSGDVQSAVLNVATTEQAESLARGVVSESFGSIAGFAAWVSNASNEFALRDNYVPGTLAQAWALGQFMLTSSATPTTAQMASQIAEITGRMTAPVLTNFYITQVTQSTSGGFDAGIVRLDNTPDQNSSTETHYLYNLNESLIMYSNLSTSPDIVAPDSICYYSEATGRGFTNSVEDLATYNGTGVPVSVIKVTAVPQFYSAGGVLSSFATLLRNIGYAGALPSN